MSWWFDVPALPYPGTLETGIAMPRKQEWLVSRRPGKRPCTSAGHWRISSQKKLPIHLRTASEQSCPTYFCPVQLTLTRKLSRCSGSTEGATFAFGIRFWKTDKAPRNSAFAALFNDLWIWLHNIETSYLARKNDRHLMRCIAAFIFLLPDDTMATTASLSPRQAIMEPRQECLHTAILSTIGRSSFPVMWVSAQLLQS